MQAVKEKLTEEIISYFYEKTGHEVPLWVKENIDFKIDAVMAFKVKIK